MSVTTEQLFDENEALKIYQNKAKFNMLEPSNQAILLGQHPSIMKTVLKTGELNSLKASAVSRAVSYYVLDVSEYRRYKSHGVAWLGKNSATLEEREQICFEVAKNPKLINKFNSAARILFFSFLKKSKHFKSILENKDLKSLELEPEVFERIQSAYDIKTDYCPVDEDGDHVWNKALWPAMAGSIGIGDELGRMHELWRITQLGEDNYRPCSNDEIRATAEVLITHPSFNNLSNCYGFAWIFMRQDEIGYYVNQAKKYDSERWIGCPFRYALGMQFDHCARLMIENPEYRGKAQGEITDRDLDAMAKKHGLESLLANIRQKEHEVDRIQRIAEEKKRKEEDLSQISDDLQHAKASIEMERKRLVELRAEVESEKQRLAAVELERQRLASEVALLEQAKLKAEFEAKQKASQPLQTQSQSLIFSRISNPSTNVSLNDSNPLDRNKQTQSKCFS